MSSPRDTGVYGVADPSSVTPESFSPPRSDGSARSSLPARVPRIPGSRTRNATLAPLGPENVREALLAAAGFDRPRLAKLVRLALLSAAEDLTATDELGRPHYPARARARTDIFAVAGVYRSKTDGAGSQLPVNVQINFKDFINRTVKSK